MISLVDYVKAEALEEQSVTGDVDWHQALRLTWTPEEIGDWLILVTFEEHESYHLDQIGVRAQLDDDVTNKMEILMAPTNIAAINDYKRHGSFFLLASLSAVQHYIDVDYKTYDAAKIAYIKNIRIIAWRLDALLASGEYTYEAVEDELTAIPTDGFTSVVNGSRNDTGKYLILFSVEAAGGSTSYSMQIRGFVNGTYFPILTASYNYLCKEPYNAVNYWSWLHGTVVTLSGATNFGIEAKSHTTAHAKVRRRRILAIDLDALGSEGTDYVYDLDTTESNMTSQTPAVKNQIQFTPGSNADYLILMASAVRTNSESYSVAQDFFEATGSELIGSSIMDAKDAAGYTDYWGAALIDIRVLATQQYTFQNRWYRVNANGTMYIKGSLVLAIKLEVITGVQHYQTIEDTLGLADALPTPKGAFKKSVSDILGMAESTSSVASFHLTASDQLGLLDAVAPRADFRQHVADQLGMLDATTPIKGLYQTIIESLGMADIVARRADFKAEITDSLGLLDATQSRSALRQAVTEILGLLESTAPRSDLKQDITEQLEMLDTTALRSDYKQLITDYLGMVDLLWWPWLGADGVLELLIRMGILEVLIRDGKIELKTREGELELR